MHVNYGITVGLEIHKNWNNFNWKLPELLQAYLFLPKLNTDFPLKEKSRFSGTLRLQKIMISVLSGLNDISHFLDHISISFKS
jgi:hypothetical protein